MNPNQTKNYKVMGINANTLGDHHLGTYETREDADKRVAEVYEKGHMEYYARVRIIEVTEEVRSTSFSADYDKGYPGVDYERQGIQHGDVKHESLQEQLDHLEDRHVGLRHDVIHDMETLEDKFEEFKGDLEQDLDELRRCVAEDKEVMGQEVADLRKELEELRGSSERRSGGPRQQAMRRHEEWEKQQEKNKEETEKWKS